jgi:hypothetical protein
VIAPVMGKAHLVSKGNPCESRLKNKLARYPLKDRDPAMGFVRFVELHSLKH